jgi:hypothetical protein
LAGSSFAAENGANNGGKIRVSTDVFLPHLPTAEAVGILVGLTLSADMNEHNSRAGGSCGNRKRLGKP